MTQEDLDRYQAETDYEYCILNKKTIEQFTRHVA